MFFISKIFTAIILPPGFVMAVITILLYINRKKLLKFNKAYFILTLTLLIIFYLLSTRPVSELLLNPLENFDETFISKITVESDPELIITLGGGSILIFEDQHFRNNLTSISKDRLLEALLIQKERKLPLLFTGGNVLKGTGSPGESAGAEEIIKRYGLAEDLYFLEDKSRNTFENAVFASEITEKRNIILVTSDFHVKRSVLCFQNAGFIISEIKTVDTRIDQKRVSIIDFLPSMSSMENSYTALHEYWGLIYYKIRYGLY